MTEETRKTEIEHVEAVVAQPNALEQMERASIDIQIATAKKYPRSLEVFYKRAIAMVTLDEETAKSCIYRRPVGKEGGKMKYVEGESVRLAEIVAASYGNIRVGGIVIEMTERHVKAVGMAHDLESNYAVRAEVVESTLTKQGVPFSERMRIVVAKAAQSKAIRDAIFRIVPKSVCKPLADKAKVVARGNAKTFETRRKNVLDWIENIKIKPERVWVAIGVNGPEDIGLDDLVLLAGLKTAIDDKDITVAEAFPSLQAEQKQGVDALAEKIAAKKEEKTTKKKRGRPKKENKNVKEPESQKKEIAPPAAQVETPTEPKSEKLPRTATKPAPKTEAKYKCLRCGRKISESKILKDDDNNCSCPYCFGDVEDL